jgi:hypothetical protein
MMWDALSAETAAQVDTEPAEWISGGFLQKDLLVENVRSLTSPSLDRHQIFRAGPHPREAFR